DKRLKEEIALGHLETWAYDAGKNTWKAMHPPREPDGWGNRRRVLVAVPDQNVILLENYITTGDKIKGVEREQQIWTYRYAEPKAGPSILPVTGVKVTTSAKGATLAWKPSPSPQVTGYAIFRGDGEKPWLVKYREIGRVAKTQTTFVDPE